jgi:hypothetical protein
LLAAESERGLSGPSTLLQSLTGPIRFPHEPAASRQPQLSASTPQLRGRDPTRCDTVFRRWPSLTSGQGGRLQAAERPRPKSAARRSFRDNRYGYAVATFPSLHCHIVRTKSRFGGHGQMQVLRWQEISCAVESPSLPCSSSAPCLSQCRGSPSLRFPQEGRSARNSQQVRAQVTARARPWIASASQGPLVRSRYRRPVGAISTPEPVRQSGMAAPDSRVRVVDFGCVIDFAKCRFDRRHTRVL